MAVARNLLRTSVRPSLVHRVPSSSEAIQGSRAVEIWFTTCIVTNLGKTHGNCSVLINPSNPQLSGVRNFPYFPRGGPVPDKKPVSMHKDWQPLGYVSQWGGMEVGSGMLYRASVIDGLVHLLGGWRLQTECRLRGWFARNGEACPVGKAVQTSAGNDRLAEEYDTIIHATPPFYKHDDNTVDKLREAYDNAFGVAFRPGRKTRVATPLLGAGARGFPIDVAIDIAAESASAWLDEKCGVGDDEQTLVFGLLEPEWAEELETRIRLRTNQKDDYARSI